ncbi:MAG: GNAT family N-acetyltransferase [Thermoplasmata archaeon]
MGGTQPLSSPAGSDIAPLEHLPEIAGADGAKLSAFFAPLLGHFVAETVRTGGTVWLYRPAGRVDGILLRRDAERIGSIFAASPGAAEALFRARGDLAVFSEYRVNDGEPEIFPVYAADLSSPPVLHRFAHTIRAAQPADVPRLIRLMREVYGGIDERWLRALPHPDEHGFVAEIEGRIVGVAWVTVVGSTGRLHSLSVAPRFRRLGVGTDLWHARAMFARSVGAHRLLTEIAESNSASRAIASAGGMRRIGQLFEYARPAQSA